MRTFLLLLFVAALGRAQFQIGLWDYSAGPWVPVRSCMTGDRHVQTDAVDGENGWICVDGVWKNQKATAALGGIPAGAILLIASGACPTGFIEEVSFNGKTLLGTLAMNADVGGVGGSDSVAPTFVGDPLGLHGHAPGTLATSAHSGLAVNDHSSHTHTYTQVVNHAHGVSFARGATTGGASTTQGFTSSVDASSTAITNVTNNPVGGVATGTTNAPSATLTHVVTQPNSHTLSGVTAAVGAGTPAGIVGSFDNRSAFVKVIFCRKT